MTKAPTAKESKLRAINRLMEAAKAGDKRVIQRLRELLETQPGAWEELGDLAGHAEAAQLQLIAGDNGLLKEAVRAKLAVLRAELEGPECPPLERLLVQRILACWLQVTYADAKYADEASRLTLAQGDYFQRRQDRAHRRLLSAIRTLAMVRKLPLPLLQLNVAQQVNVGQEAVGRERPTEPGVTIEVE